MDVVGDLLDVDVELDVELRLDLPLEDLRRVRILDREVLDILGEDRDLRLVAAARPSRCRRWSVPGPPFICCPCEISCVSGAARSRGAFGAATSSRNNGAQWRLVRCGVGIFDAVAHYVAARIEIGPNLTVIVILALVALFIGLRLYSVLGERTGHEQQPILKPAETGRPSRAARRPPAVTQPAPADAGDMAFVPTAGPGVRAILAADPSFDVARFLEGAKAAYRMILEAFWKGDLEPVRGHVDDHVYETFVARDRAARARTASCSTTAWSRSSRR